jgi:hypothetical protein
MVFTSLLA